MVIRLADHESTFGSMLGSWNPNIDGAAELVDVLKVCISVIEILVIAH